MSDLVDIEQRYVAIVYERYSQVNTRVSGDGLSVAPRSATGNSWDR